MEMGCDAEPRQQRRCDFLTGPLDSGSLKTRRESEGPSAIPRLRVGLSKSQPQRVALAR